MGAGLLAESEYDSTNSAFVLPNRREDMMIIKNDIPILEYDDSSPEVIPPDHDWSAGKLPEKCLFAFLGDVVHEYANKT